MTTLVFIHGRGQEGKDPRALLEEWDHALSAGLGLARPPVQAVMAYYGNVLHRVTAEIAGLPDLAEAVPVEATQEVPFHPYLPAETGTLERCLMADLAGAVGSPLEAGIEDILTWTLARQMLQWVCRRTGVDKEIIKVFLQDVAVYLSHGRQPVLAEVRRQLPADGPIVLVTHSLGTVVGRDLLVEEAVRRRVTLWVTAGSPLGLPTIQRNLLARGTVHPGVDWLTTYDVNDVVALGHPLERSWGTPLRQVEVENGNEPHSIDRYLGHPTVATPIGRTCA
ncbi:hypothetical protein MF672_009980 [Actinomadura sp. ATCC 31491]|uniref:Serine peptidase n=1 Tax=Actinomadura luzonensis TaxID=2805427 RepID=A0ABT0FPB5_9ACTN|nr:hypothetical protein [Actinomadura luzonensis]MCK2214116.1 hypothetical protein [Actinomadura luzonensis]